MQYPSLPARLIIGGVFFATAAALDLRRNGRLATRWREYVFLLACSVIAMVYGLVNDQITSAISWEYFYYGKDLKDALGPNTPPDPVALHVQAAKIGMMATWWVGLILGVALLIANNPRDGWPRLSFGRLLVRVPVVLAIAIGFSVAGGFAGYSGWLNSCSDDFVALWRLDLWHPPRFMAAWGVHLGGYVGGLVGGVLSVASIVRRRAQARR